MRKIIRKIDHSTKKLTIFVVAGVCDIGAKLKSYSFRPSVIARIRQMAKTKQSPFSLPTMKTVRYPLVILILLALVFFNYLSPKQTVAYTNITHNSPNNTAFNASGATAASVNVSSNEVKLAADSDWWNSDFADKRAITITNTQATAIAAGTTVTLTMDTKQFVDAGKMQADGDDLRIAYKNAANDWSEVRRTFSYLGTETFATSTRTQVTFTTATIIALSGSDTNYALYYGNATVNYNWSNGLKFDGSSTSTVTVGDKANLKGLTYMTAEAMVKSASSPSGENAIFGKYNGGCGNGGSFLLLNGSGTAFTTYFVKPGGTCYPGASKSGLKPNTWYHVAMTWNNGVGSLYINGYLAARADSGTTGALGSGSAPFYISGYGGNNYAGTIDEVRISNNVRYDPGNNSAVNQKVFNPPAQEYSSDANTMGLWHLDDGSGGTAVDSSSSSYNGTVGANTTWYTPNQQSFGDETFVAPFNNSTTGIDGETPSSFARNSVATYEDENGVLQEASANTPRYETGNRGQNMLYYSSFEDGADGSAPTGWQNSGGTIVKASGSAVHGNSYAIVTGGLSGGAMSTNINVANSTQYTVTFYTKFISGINSGLDIRLYQGGTVIGDTGYITVTNDGAWHKVSKTFTTTAAGSAQFRILGNWNTGASTVWNIDAVQLQQSSTASDYVPTTTQPADNNRGIVIEEARTNYLKISSFEADTNSDGVADNWAKSDATVNDPTWSISSSEHKHSAKSQRVQYTGVAGDATAYFKLTSDMSDVGTFAPGNVIAASVHAKGSINGANYRFFVMWFDAAGGYLDASYSSNFTPTSSWTRTTLTTAAAPAGASRAQMVIQVVNIDDGDTIDTYFDAAQMEKGAFATSYIPTTTASVARAKENLQYTPSAVVNPAAGSFSFWVKTSNDLATDSTRQYVIGSSASGSYLWMYFTNSTTHKIALSTYNATAGWVTVNSGTISANTWYHIAGTWSSSGSAIYANGTAGGSSALNCAVAAADVLYIGANQAGNLQGNFTLSDFRVYNTVLTSTQVADMYRSGLAYHGEGSEEIDRYPSTGGTYTSPVLDFSGNADWQGAPNFVPTASANGGTITYQTRTGAVATPDGTWSAYQNVSGNTIASPFSRYFQWKSSLSPPADQSNTPSLTSLDTKYIQDTTEPTNPTTVHGYNSSGKTVEYTSGGWGSADEPAGPYFEWSGATDDYNIYGYYVYFGPTVDADPFTAGTLQTTANFTNTTSLVNGTTNYLRVRAVDRAGNKYTDADVSQYHMFTYQYDGTVPNSPEYVNSNPVGCSTASTFTMTWPVATNPGGTIDHYIYKNGSGGTTHNTTELTATATPYQEGDNVFYIKAVSLGGAESTYWATGIYCSTGIAYLVDGPAIAAGPSSIVVTWTTSKATTSYVQVYDGNTYVSEQGQSDFVISHSVKIVGLEPEKSYSYKIVWLDGSSNAGESDWYTTNTAQAPQVNDLDIQIVSNSSAVVSWTTSMNAVCSIEYGLSDYGTIIKLDGTGTQFSRQITGLAGGSVYQLRINATGTDGTKFFGGKTIQTPPLPIITNFKFNPITDQAASATRVTWTTNVETTSTVFYGTKGSNKKELSTSEKVKDHSMDILNLDDSTTYEIYASGIDQFGNVATSDVNTFQTALDTRPPTITDLAIETSNVGLGQKDTAQIAISWKTDELATSQVEYAEGLSGDQYTKKTIEDATLTNSHLVIISDLTPSKPYHLKVVSKDKASNIANSPDNTVISGEVPKSVLNIILQTLNQIFGWIGKLLP